MNNLTEEAFYRQCESAEQLLRQCGPGSPAASDHVRPDYGMYRLGDTDFLAIGLTWVNSKNQVRSAKIQNGVITDHYIIFGEDSEYRSAQIDPVTEEYIALYKAESAGAEPKLDPVTGELLQQNFYTAYNPLPAHYLEALEQVNFPFIDAIFCWADKPYGSCVEFAAMTRKRKNPDNWFHLPYTTGTVDGVSIRKFNGGYGLFAAAAGATGKWPDDLWMCTDWQAVAELLSQVELATGRVLVTGLGLGLVALLVANKPEVTSVTVVENNDSVIKLFLMQGFDLTKINIVQQDVLSYTDDTFDSILLDHYNYIGDEPILGIKHASEVIRKNTNSWDAITVPYRWHEFIAKFGSSTIRWGKALGLPHLPLADEIRYSNAYLNAVDAIPSIVKSLNEIDSKRK
jgi:hypothetical protein